MQDLDLWQYVYWQFSVAVLFSTEIVKQLSKGLVLNRPLTFVIQTNPKWLTLICAVIISLGDWLVFGNGKTFHFMTYLISFGITVLGYDYAWKLVKDFFGKKDNP